MAGSDWIKLFCILEVQYYRAMQIPCKQVIKVTQLKINWHAICGPPRGWCLTLCVRSLLVGTSSFRGEQKAVTQQAHSLLPQWDKHNNRRDQCTQGQQRADKGFLKDQQAWFTIYIAQKRALLKKNWLNLMELKIRSVFSSTVFLWYSLSAVIRLWLLSHFSANQMQLVGPLKSKVEFVLHWVWNRRLSSSVWIKEKLLQVTFVQFKSGMDANSGQSALPWHVFYI